MSLVIPDIEADSLDAWAERLRVRIGIDKALRRLKDCEEAA